MLESGFPTIRASELAVGASRDDVRAREGGGWSFSREACEETVDVRALVEAAVPEVAAMLRLVPMDEAAPCDFVAAMLVRVPSEDAPTMELGLDGIFDTAVEVLMRELAVPEGGLANEGMGARVCATEDREDLTVSVPLTEAAGCDSGRGFCSLAEVDTEDLRAVEVALLTLGF